MSRVQLPIKTEKEIKSFVYGLADSQKYLGMTREQSGIFMDQLTKSEKVGGILMQYMEKSRVHRYIKDAILNRYSKNKTKEGTPQDVTDVIEEIFKFKVISSHSKNDVDLFRASEAPHHGKFIVVAKGTYVKWETALRKALIYRAAYPFSQNATEIHNVLLLATRGSKITLSDQKLLQNALLPFKTVAVIY